MIMIILGQTTRPRDNQQKKRTCQTMDFALPADHRVIIKESKMTNKYQDTAKELKNYGT